MTGRILLRPSTVAILLAVAEAELISGPLRWEPLQAALAIPLVLYLPGMALRRALIPQKSDQAPDQILIALGLSLAVLTVGGVALNLLSVGMRPMTWLLYLTAVTVCAETLAITRTEVDVPAPYLRPRDLALGTAILAILAASFAISIIGAHRQSFLPFAQFWLVPERGGRGHELGVRNRTGHAQTYRVSLEVKGRRARLWGPISLASGQSWNVSVRLREHSSVRARLFRGDRREGYREVRIRG